MAGNTWLSTTLCVRWGQAAGDNQSPPPNIEITALWKEDTMSSGQILRQNKIHTRAPARVQSNTAQRYTQPHTPKTSQSRQMTIGVVCQPSAVGICRVGVLEKSREDKGKNDEGRNTARNYRDNYLKLNVRHTGIPTIMETNNSFVCLPRVVKWKSSNNRNQLLLCCSKIRIMSQPKLPIHCYARTVGSASKDENKNRTSVQFFHDAVCLI